MNCDFGCFPNHSPMHRTYRGIFRSSVSSSGLDWDEWVTVESIQFPYNQTVWKAEVDAKCQGFFFFWQYMLSRFLERSIHLQLQSEAHSDLNKHTHALWFINENHKASDGIYRNMSVCSKEIICSKNKYYNYWRCRNT